MRCPQREHGSCAGVVAAEAEEEEEEEEEEEGKEEEGLFKADAVNEEKEE